MHALSKKTRTQMAPEAALADNVSAAKEAGLHYVHDDAPGYTRRRGGHQFKYFDTEGKPIRDQQRLLRIKRLAIPPAWSDVWICPSPSGHIQVTGRDARRRKQYRYHDRWRESRDETKFGRLAAFAEALPRIRRRLAKDIKLAGLPREKVLATVVQLLERTFIRIGNEEYARNNKSFGLSTIRGRHVTVRGAQLRFRFRGKSGRQHEVDVTDRRIAKIVSKCQDLPGQKLFQYIADDGEVRDIASEDVNDYLREIASGNFTAKDFRTWGATVLMAIALSVQGKFTSRKQAMANVRSAICAVAEFLRNTPAICRKCYVHPAVIEGYLNRTPIAGLTSARKSTGLWDLRAAEKALLKFLRTPLSKDRNSG